MNTFDYIFVINFTYFLFNILHIFICDINNNTELKNK